MNLRKNPLKKLGKNTWRNLETPGGISSVIPEEIAGEIITRITNGTFWWNSRRNSWWIPGKQSWRNLNWNSFMDLLVESQKELLKEF